MREPADVQKVFVLKFSPPLLQLDVNKYEAGNASGAPRQAFDVEGIS